MVVKFRDIATEHVSGTWYFTNGDNSTGDYPGFPLSNGYSLSYLPKYEKISYDNSQKRTFNACSHQAYTIGPLGTHSYTNRSDPSAPGYSRYDGVPWLPGDLTVDWPSGSLPSTFWSGLAKQLKPKLKSPVSLPNFLYELKDIPEMIEDLTSQINSALKRASGHSFLRRKARSAGQVGRRLDAKGRRASKNYLAYKFGLAPLLDDITNLAHSYMDFLDQYEDFLKGVGAVHKAHYKETQTSSDWVVSVVSAGNPWTWAKRDQIQRAVYVGTIWYSYMPLISPPPPGPTTYLKYLGFRANPRIIWDAIPFSFVIDWVFRVGKWLEQFDPGAIPVRVTIIDCCVSSKLEFTRQWYHAYTPSGSTISTPGGNFTFATATGKVYNRQRYLPQEIPSIIGLAIDGLSMQEAVLGGALLYH